MVVIGINCDDIGLLVFLCVDVCCVLVGFVVDVLVIDVLCVLVVCVVFVVWFVVLNWNVSGGLMFVV